MLKLHNAINTNRLTTNVIDEDVCGMHVFQNDSV